MTSDGEWIALHDATPTRTANVADPCKVPALDEVPGFLRGCNTANGTWVVVYAEQRQPFDNPRNARIIASANANGFPTADTVIRQPLGHRTAIDLASLLAPGGTEAEVARPGSVRPENGVCGATGSDGSDTLETIAGAARAFRTGLHGFRPSRSRHHAINNCVSAVPVHR